MPVMQIEKENVIYQISMEDKKMRKKLVNKHVVRAISLGLAAVMASTPVTALACDDTTDGSEDNTLRTDEIDTKTEEYRPVEEQVQTAETAAETAIDVVEEVGALDNVVALVNGTEINYDNVSADLMEGKDDLYNGEVHLIEAEGNAVQAESAVNAYENAKSELDSSNFNDNMNAISDAKKDADDAAQASVDAYDAAKEADDAKDKEALVIARDEAQEAFDKATVASDEAQVVYENSVDLYNKAEEEYNKAKALVENLEDKLSTTKEDMDNALKHMQDAENKAKALRETVDANEKALGEAVAKQLEAAYNKMMATAEGQIYSVYDGEAASGQGDDDKYTTAFGREKASSEYWKDSLEYFKLCIESIYNGEANVNYEWISKGEHFAKNNMYKVTYTDGEEVVTKYYNYHIADDKGNIFIYEKTDVYTNDDATVPAQSDKLNDFIDELLVGVGVTDNPIFDVVPVGNGYEVTVPGKGTINVVESGLGVFTASYELEVDGVTKKADAYWQERKDSEINNVNLYNALKKAHEEVDIARREAKDAREALDSLLATSAEYRQKLDAFNSAMKAMNEAEANLKDIEDKVKTTGDYLDQINEMLLAFDNEEKGINQPGTEPNPTVNLDTIPTDSESTVNPTNQTPQAVTQTADTIPTVELGGQQAVEGSQMVVGGQGEATSQGDELVDIADEEVPLADGNQGVEDDEEDSTLTIEEEEVPLAAAPVAKEKMSWWWLLIVALMGKTGYEMYKKRQEKKELNNK